MKKIGFLLLLAVMTAQAGIAQPHAEGLSPLHDWVAGQRLQATHRSSPQLLESGITPQKNQYGTYYTLQLNLSELQTFYRDGARYATISLPIDETQTVVLELAETTVLTDDCVVNAVDHGREAPAEFQQPRTFRGIVQGTPRRSLVSLTISETGLQGVICIGNRNYNLGPLGKQRNTAEYVLFAEQDLRLPLGFTCFANDQTYRSPSEPQAAENRMEVLAKCVRVRMEINNGLYNALGGTVQDVVDYVAGVYNVVAAIYFNENIETNISQIQIWTTPDPYPGANSGVALSAFGGNIQNTIGGDLAHLLASYPGGNGNGGLAWIDVLCASYNAADSSGRYAYSNVDGFFLNFPTYTWDVEVITHEMGHNLGSPHTHACAWGGSGNNRIDDCGNVVFTTNGVDDDGDATIDEVDEAEGGACFTPMAPIMPAANTGTIMSYCHLNVGIGFANGFGPEPGNLIRSRVSGAGCLAGCSGQCLEGYHLYEAINAAVNIEAERYIMGNNLVSIPAGLVKYDAGDFIRLRPGFHAVAGATGTFHALIDGCGGALKPNGGSEDRTVTATAATHDILLYPNPATETVSVRIRLDLPDEVGISLYNTLGQTTQVLRQPQYLPAGEHTLELTLESCAPGAYWLVVQTGEQRIAKKLSVLSDF